MKISLITVCWNSAAVIRTALESVFAQAGAEIEYIVVDGGSTDGTVEILKEYEARIGRSNITYRWISEKDNGMYDALNKGIRMSTGEVIGWLNADDILASDEVLAKVAEAFEANPDIDGTYGDIRFVRDTLESPEAPPQGAHRRNTAVSLRSDFRSLRALRDLPTTRYCSGKRFRPWMFRFGVQTAHPSTFFRRAAFDRWGFYSLDFGMFGDFELLCRFIWKNRARMRYLPICTTVMRSGGASTNGWRTTIKINRTDIRALRANGCVSFLPLLYLRYFFKIWGFLSRARGRD